VVSASRVVGGVCVVRGCDVCVCGVCMVVRGVCECGVRCTWCGVSGAWCLRVECGAVWYGVWCVREVCGVCDMVCGAVVLENA
jgi:hypothetical protein